MTAGSRNVRRVGVAAAAALLLAAAAVGVQALRIHNEDGQWGLMHPAAPKLLSFEGHKYVRGSAPRHITRGAPDEWPSVDIAVRGRTNGGGVIFAPSRPLDAPPPGPDPEAVIWVQEDPKGGLAWQYELADNP